jgi:hypothetical protein
MGLQEFGLGGLNWIDLAHVRERWWALVNVVNTSRFHKMQGIS